MLYRRVYADKNNSSDITKLKVNAIVNTINSSFELTGELDHCIHQLAGKELDVECKKIGKLKVGQACLTSGYELCKYIIHTASQYGIDKDHAVNYESDSLGDSFEL